MLVSSTANPLLMQRSSAMTLFRRQLVGNKDLATLNGSMGID